MIYLYIIYWLSLNLFIEGGGSTHIGGEGSDGEFHRNLLESVVARAVDRPS